MDLDAAIDRHNEWKIIFRMAIEQRTAVDAATIGRDDCCVLGKWLYSEGKVLHGDKSPFAGLVTSHAAFHQNAGAVAEAINAGDFATAEKMLGVWSEYMDASMAVVDAIEALQKAVDPAG